MALWLLAGCGGDSATVPEKTFVAEERTGGSLPLTTSSRVVARNAIGSVHVEGESLGPQVRWFAHAALLTLGIPAGTPCTIAGAFGEARTRYLQAGVVIRDAGAVNVLDHTGSCRVESTGGDVFVRPVLPDGGECRVYTPSGNVTAEVPADATATVFLATGNGTISVNRLELADSTAGAGTLTGRLGDGEGTIRLETGHGDIVLRSL
jgi:hypothetical protein